ncbi:hypothetical protein BBJ28_00015405 [Nothophytophthora sp. Chile5]|nr:hypothetical protein BBJ28_00015405 [Nothophytophthora sp. Chile5]
MIPTFDTLGFGTVGDTFNGTTSSWTEAGDGSVTITFQSLDTEDVTVNVITGGDDFDEIEVAAGETVTWSSNARAVTASSIAFSSLIIQLTALVPPASASLVMGNVLSFSLDSVCGMLATYSGDRESRIMIVGLDAAGKTTLLYQLKLGQHEITTIPTLGFNVETFQYKTMKFTAWDISGQKHIQSLWRHYLSNNDAVIFVVDAADRTRIDEAQQALHFIFEQEELSITKLLVYANKQDKSDTMSADEIREKLDLTEATRNPSHVQPCVATTGAGVHDGLDWLVRALTSQITV